MVTISRPVGAAASTVLDLILGEISVAFPVIREARKRRDAVLEIARGLSIVRGRYSSGSVAYGTANRPLEDADGGVKINRRLADMREFGPDAPGGLAPDQLMGFFGEYIVQRLRAGSYPDATVDVDGKRAVKFELHSPVEFDELDEPVDPYVDFIIGLARVAGQGLWIPNRSVPAGWDIADPEHHLQVMNHRPTRDLRVHRAHVIRLAKRAIKRDSTIGRIPALCSWNVSALAITLIRTTEISLPDSLALFFGAAATEIATGLTPDPSPVVDPIDLPHGFTNATAARRLAEMAEHAREAAQARSVPAARLPTPSSTVRRSTRSASMRLVAPPSAAGSGTVASAVGIAV